ncbi:MAG: helix-turn-helix transcriptional regulator [Novosphingobium sp.]
MARTKVDPERDYGLITLADPARRELAGAIVQDEFDIDAPWHHHDMHQLQYAFEGSMELEDEHGRHLLPRSLAGWIPAGTRHRNSLHRISSLSVLLASDSVPVAGSGVRILRVSPLMRAMIAEAARWPLGRPQDATGAAFFAAFARLCTEWIADAAPLTLPTSTHPALCLALAHARADPAGSRMSEAARLAGLSERSLRRHCQAQLGMGWDEYRRRARLLASIEALTETDRSIAQIAGDVGFDSQSAYARAFRRLTGQVPHAFRAEARQRM